MTRSAWIWACVVGASVVVPPSFAIAQECAEGRVVTPDSAGRCCWPGQRWSETGGRCSGPPNCPEGRVADGDGCVPATAPESRTTALITPIPPPLATPPIAEPTARATAPLAWPPSHPPTGAANPRRSLAPDAGWIAAGSAVLAVGYLGALILGSIQLADDHHCQERGALSFIPIVGSFVHLGVSGTRCESSPDVTAEPRYWDLLPGSLQVIGLAALLFAVALPNTPDASWDQAARIGDVRVAVWPWAPASELGTSVALRF